MRVCEGGGDGGVQDLMSGVAAAATKVEDVPVVLNEVHLANTFGSLSSIYDRIKRHYVQQWLVVVSRSLGSLNMLGNPLGLVTSLYSGVTDIFKEPAKQLQSGRLAGRQSLLHMTQDLSRGLQRGSLSLLTHSLVGWCNTISKVSSSGARFVAYLSMDDDFACDISRPPHERDQPQQIGLLPGFVVAIGCLARVPALAAQRAWKQPHRGPWALFPVPAPGNLQAGDGRGGGGSSVTVVQRGGAALPALALGCVQALVCIVAKPLAGLLDTLSYTCFSLQDAWLFFIGTQAASALRHRSQRVRPPRHFGPDKVRGALLCLDTDTLTLLPCSAVSLLALQSCFACCHAAHDALCRFVSCHVVCFMSCVFCFMSCVVSCDLLLQVTFLLVLSRFRLW